MTSDRDPILHPGRAALGIVESTYDDGPVEFTPLVDQRQSGSRTDAPPAASLPART
jgi:hypothetical protein